MPDHLRQNWLTYLLGAVLIALAAYFFAPKAHAETVAPRVAELPYAPAFGGVFELEISGGAGLSNDELKGFGSKVDLSQTGMLGGIGVGYMIQRGDLFFGPMARFNVMRVNGAADSATIKSDQLWEAAAKVGRCWHTAADKCKVAFYGLVGWAEETLDLRDFGSTSKHPNGLLLGGGIEAHLTGATYARLEYDHYGFSGQSLGVGEKVTPDLSVIRLGVAWKFWDRSTAAPLK